MEDTLKGKLPCGIMLDGQLHREFEIRLPLMKDNVAAVSKYPDRGALEISIAVMIEATISLGDIPKEKLTLDFLLENLIEYDFDALSEAFSRLKKKRQEWVESLNTTTQPESSWVVTVSVKMSLIS